MFLVRIWAFVCVFFLCCSGLLCFPGVCVCVVQEAWLRWFSQAAADDTPVIKSPNLGSIHCSRPNGFCHLRKYLHVQVLNFLNSLASSIIHYLINIKNGASWLTTNPFSQLGRLVYGLNLIQLLHQLITTAALISQIFCLHPNSIRHYRACKPPQGKIFWTDYFRTIEVQLWIAENLSFWQL